MPQRQERDSDITISAPKTREKQRSSKKQKLTHRGGKTRIQKQTTIYPVLAITKVEPHQPIKKINDAKQFKLFLLPVLITKK